MRTNSTPLQLNIFKISPANNIPINKAKIASRLNISADVDAFITFCPNSCR